MYRNESSTPARGTKLNRPALCTIEDISPPEDFDGDFGAYLRDEYSAQIGATFVDYDAKTKVWVFRVEHFTRYAFNSAQTPKRLEKPVEPTVFSVHGN